MWPLATQREPEQWIFLTVNYVCLQNNFFIYRSFQRILLSKAAQHID